jgi:type II secretory ATPase GspE/PulE/Tfp pilus assembly ATPase PilB-like protein
MNPRAAHFGAEEVDLRNVSFTPELLACVPAESARRYRVLPVFRSREVLGLAVSDPSDLDAIDALSNLLHRDLELCVAEESQLEEFIERLYGGEGARFRLQAYAESVRAAIIQEPGRGWVTAGRPLLEQLSG